MAELENEVSRFLVEDRETRHVRRQEVGGELYLSETPAHAAGESLGHDCLAESRHVLEEDMPAGEQSDRHQFQRASLAHHDERCIFDDRRDFVYFGMKRY